MVCRKRPAKAPGTSGAACLKRPAKASARGHALRTRGAVGSASTTACALGPPKVLPRKRPAAALGVGEASTGKRVRAKCACGKDVQHCVNQQFYCRGCFRKNHPEAATAAYQRRSEQEAARKKRPCSGAPEHQGCTSRGDYADPRSKQHYCLRCLLLVSPEAAQRSGAARRVREGKRTRPQLSKGRSCYYCFLALPADRAPYACACGTESHPSHVSMCDRCFGLHTKATCAACWNQRWEKNCFRCGDKFAQPGKKSGRFFRSCF